MPCNGCGALQGKYDCSCDGLVPGLVPRSSKHFQRVQQLLQLEKESVLSINALAERLGEVQRDWERERKEARQERASFLQIIGEMVKKI